MLVREALYWMSHILSSYFPYSWCTSVWSLADWKKYTYQREHFSISKGLFKNKNFPFEAYNPNKLCQDLRHQSSILFFTSTYDIRQAPHSQYLPPNLLGLSKLAKPQSLPSITFSTQIQQKMWVTFLSLPFATWRTWCFLAWICWWGKHPPLAIGRGRKSNFNGMSYSTPLLLLPLIKTLHNPAGTTETIMYEWVTAVMFQSPNKIISL